MRKNIKELEEEITAIVGTSFSTIEYTQGQKAYITLTERYGISDDKLKAIEKLCKKENMIFYVSSKFFSNRIIISMYDKGEDEK